MEVQFRPEVFKRLVTERLVLRNIYDEDVKDLYDNIYSNYEWHKYGYSGHITSISNCANLMNKYIYRSKNGEYLMWGVVEKKSNNMVGIVMLYSYDMEENKCKMGCLMSYNHSSKGYAKEAVSSVINFTFNELALRKIQIEIVSENIPSLRLAKKLGMRYESTKSGTYRLGDKCYDEKVFYKLNPIHKPKIKIK